MTEIEVQVYDFEGKNVRTMVLNEEPWFVGRDIAEALEYKTTRNAIERHVDDEDKQTLLWRDCPETGRTKIWKGNDHSNKVIINESGMYSLIMGSKLDSAKRFKHWVTSEVLPSIRKHGAYMTNQKAYDITHNKGALADLLLQAGNQLKEAYAKIEEDKPKVQLADAIGQSKDEISMSDMAKILNKNGINIGRNRLYSWSRDNKLVMQYANEPTQYAVNQGYLVVHETTSFDSRSNPHINVVVRVTSKGQKYILKKFNILEK